MFFTDKNMNSVTLIIDNNSLKTHIIAFWKQMHLGNTMLIVNPAFEGYFSGMPLLKCEGILPTEEIAAFYSTIKVNNTSDEKHIFACFATKEFKLKSISLSASPCKGACDSKYGRDCYCMKQ